jgi:hypothetical protein
MRVPAEPSTSGESETTNREVSEVEVLHAPLDDGPIL